MEKGRLYASELPVLAPQWEVAAGAAYQSLPLPYRYKLKQRLTGTYGRALANTIMQYVYDSLRQGCAVHAWWFRGKRTEIFCQHQAWFFHLLILPAEKAGD